MFARRPPLSSGITLASLSSDPRALFDQLFDVEFYVEQVEGLDPASAKSHYRELGWQQGLCPTPLFSPEWYLAQREELQSEEPLSDYLEHGARLGLDPYPLFCTKTYRAAAGLTDASVNPLLHYLAEGWRHGQVPHRLIDWPYAQQQLPRGMAGRIDPLWFISRVGHKKNCRVHPMFYPPRLAIPPRMLQLDVTRARMVAEFVTWNHAFSPSPLLDAEFYLAQYPEAAELPGGAWEHFLSVGQFGDYDPNPYFDSRFYRQRYGRMLGSQAPFRHYMAHEQTLKFQPNESFDIRHYCRRAPTILQSQLSPLEHFLEQGRHRSVELQPFKTPAFLREQLREAAALEPDVLPKKSKLDALPVYNRHQSSATAYCYDNIRRYLGKRFEALVLAPYLNRGGADLATTNLVRWLHEKHGAENVALVLTDTNKIVSRDWLPDDTRMVNFSHFDPTLKLPQRELLVQYLIEEFGPRYCYNVNSKAAWSLFGKKGRGLAQITELYAQLFCFDYDKHGRPVGYAIDGLPRALSHLRAVYLDNDKFRRVLRDSFNFPSRDRAKLKTLYQPSKGFGYQVPIEPLIKRLGRDTSYRRQIFWAGRLDRQKRPDIMLEVARRCPAHDFHVFGTSVVDSALLNGAELPANVTLYGEYDEFFNLPLEKADLFLYTSAWDGLPLILIDIVQSGVPVIVPDVGGITELVDNTTGWVVSDYDDCNAYLNAIRQATTSPDLCRQKVAAGQARLAEQHAWTAYRKVLESDRVGRPARSNRPLLSGTPS